MIRIIPIIAIALLFHWKSVGQIIVIDPFAAEQSHPELNIDKIIFYTDSTVINLTVENKLDKGGWFCADNNIYMENPATRQRFQIIRSVGIPSCPSTHDFSKKGETLSFTLVFPPIPLGAKTLNLVENCNKACFSFKGIILDEKMNRDIRTFNQAMEYYTANKIDEAVESFIKVIEEIPPFPIHVYGYSYYHLVIIHQTKGDNLTAKYWFDQLEKSVLPDKQYFIEAIRKDKGLPK